MKILNLLTAGGVGGIEILCRDIALKSNIQNCFFFLFGEGMIYEQMKNANLEVYSFDKKKISIKKLNRLKSVANSCDVIVVHHDDPFLQMYYLELMKLYPDKKFISMFHHCYDPTADGLEYGLLKRMIKKWLILKMLKKSDKLIFVSEAGYKSYSDNFKVYKNKVDVVYNGISEGKLETGKKVKKSKSEIIKLVYVGRLVKLKGVDSLVEILPVLDKEYKIHLDIVGDGTCRKELEDRVYELGMDDKVSFWGFQENVNPYLTKADIFIYPSHTEIFGISIVEAMAFKCICVASNVGGIPEIINDGVNGFLNRDNTEDGLHHAICKAISVYNDNINWDKMMNKARTTAESFSIDKTIYELEKIYMSLVRD